MKSLSAALLMLLLTACGIPELLRSKKSGTQTLLGNLNYPTCTTLTADGNIVFTFNRPVYCGHFVTGEWWVSPIDSQGFQIISMTPNYVSGTLSHHGYMVNPAARIMTQFQPPDPPFPDSAAVLRNSFDSRAGSFYEPQPLPISVAGELAEPTSIVKAQSANVGSVECAYWLNGTKMGTCLKRVAIVTVMPTPADYSGKFRPHPYRSSPSPYAAPNAPTFSAPKIAYPATPNWNLFTNLPAPGFSSIQTALASIPCGRNGHFWFGKESGAAQYHPTDCSMTWGGSYPTGYHAYLPFPWLFLRAMHADAAPYRADLLYSTFQYAIDLKGVVDSGYQPITAGGHHVGWKFLIMLTGHILGIPEMRDIGLSHTTVPNPVPGQPNLTSRIFSEDGIAYPKWDGRVGEMIPTYGGSCGITDFGGYSGINNYVAHILNFNSPDGVCGHGPKACEATPSTLLTAAFPWVRDPTQNATDGGCVHEGNGRPHRSTVDQYRDWANSNTPVDDFASYQAYFGEFLAPYAAIVWKLGLESSYNYDTSLKYMGRYFFCDPWRAKRPSSTWNATTVYYHNWFLDNYVTNPYACPVW